MLNKYGSKTSRNFLMAFIYEACMCPRKKKGGGSVSY